MATLKVKKLSSKAVLPKYQSRGAAGFDLCSTEELVIPVGKWALIATGLAFGIKRGYEIQIRPRSGLALKYGFTILNTPGTIDSDYRGEIKVIAMNFGEKDFRIKVGDRIAQAVLCKVKQAKIKETASLNKTKRGSCGFGSTGI